MNNKTTNEDIPNRFVTIIPIIRTKDELPRYMTSKRINRRKMMYGFYQTPGGHIKENEDPIQAAIREFQEETGIMIYRNQLKKVFTQQYEKVRDTQKPGECVIYEIEIMKMEGKKFKNNEPKEMDDWQLRDITQLITQEVIDSLKWHIAQEIDKLTKDWQINIIEGPIGVGKSTLIKNLNKRERYHVIPEVAISEKIKPKLQEFYERKITPTEFQNIVEMAYLEELVDLLTNYTKDKPIIMDRTQTATEIFSKINGIDDTTIEQIKRYRCYWEKVTWKANIFYIECPKLLMTYNIYRRNRNAEKKMTYKYAWKVHGDYYTQFLESYKYCFKNPQILRNNIPFYYKNLIKQFNQ